MNARNESGRADGRFEEMVQAIEKRTIKIAGVKTHLRVLGIHPSQSSDESESEVTLRLALRPDNDSQLGIVQESSFEARLSELGFMYPWRLDGKFERQVDELVKVVEEDAPRALQRSPAPRVVFIDPVSAEVKAVAAVVSLSVTATVAVLGQPVVQVIPQEALAAASQAIFLVVVATLIYKVLTTRFKLNSTGKPGRDMEQLLVNVHNLDAKVKDGFVVRLMTQVLDDPVKKVALTEAIKSTSDEAQQELVAQAVRSTETVEAKKAAAREAVQSAQGGGKGEVATEAVKAAPHDLATQEQILAEFRK